MKYAAFYINLDRSPERKARIEQELSKNGLKGYKRFAASEGNALHFPNPHLREGEMGCFTSHYRLLKENLASQQPLHIIEDDIILSPEVEKIFDEIIESGELSKYDLVYTDVAIPIQNNLYKAYKTFYDAQVKPNHKEGEQSFSFTIIDMKGLPFASTCSFLVNPHSISKLMSLYEEELKKGARVPIDLFIRHLCLQGVLRVVSLFPFITSIRPESCFATTIDQRFEVLPALAANILRHSFFIGCDWQRCLDYATRAFPYPEASDLHRQLMLRLLGTSLVEKP